MGLPPKEITSVKFSFNSTPDLASVDIGVTEIFTSILNKKSSPCSKSETIDFNDCSIKYSKAFLSDMLKCTIPGNVSFR